MEQGLMFSPQPGPVTSTTMKREKKTETEKKTRKTNKVSRSKKLKRHPSRPPAKKRIVSTKRVAMVSHPDGPFGDIVETYKDGPGETQVGVVWDGKGDKIYRSNPRFLIPIERTE